MQGLLQVDLARLRRQVRQLRELERVLEVRVLHRVVDGDLRQPVLGQQLRARLLEWYIKWFFGAHFAHNPLTQKMFTFLREIPQGQTPTLRQNGHTKTTSCTTLPPPRPTP